MAKKVRVTVKGILAEWLKSKIGREFAYHDLEKIKAYAQIHFDVLHNMGTYDRAFRELKSDSKEMLDHGFRLEEVMKPNSTVQYWKVVSA